MPLHVESGPGRGPTAMIGSLHHRDIAIVASILPVVEEQSVEVSELVGALVDIERAAREFTEMPDADAADRRLLETLHRCHRWLDEPYGFDSNTDALRRRVWKDCMTIISNLELAPRHAAGQQSELVRTQAQKLATLTKGLLDLVRPRTEKR